MFVRRLLLALSPTVLAACFEGAAQAVGATSGPISHWRDRRNPFRGVAPVDLDAAAVAALAGVGAVQSAFKTCTGPCGRTSVRASSAWTCRGGATQQGPGPTDYASTLQDQSRPWWTEDKKSHLIRSVPPKNKKGFFPHSTKQNAPAKNNASCRNKTVQDSWPAMTAHVSEYLSGGGWLFLAALPAVLLGGRGGSGGAKGMDPDGVKARPPKTKVASKVVRVKCPPSKAVKMAKRGGSGVHAASRTSLARALVPDTDYARVVGVVVLAALGSGGFYALAANDLLRAEWPIMLADPWQVLTVVAWAVNMRITLIRGRLDGSSQAEPFNARPVGFFTPASWAFSIWAPIFLGEMLFAFYQLLPFPSIRGAWWLSDICPWFCGAMLFQSLWCASFRPWARDAGLLWLPAMLLGGVAVALGGVHVVLRDAWFAGDIEIPQYLVAHLPLSLHFGWISCASLVNLNGYFASVTSFSNRVKLALSLCTVLAAVVLGAVITLVREDPVYAGVVAWALWAVGSEGGWRNLKGRVDPGEIRAQELAAKFGSILALTAAGVPLGIYLRDVIMGVEGEYNEGY